nr:HD-GYP domain-containing protein [Sphingomonas daechungensis]
MFSRIALLAQVADVFHTHAGRDATIEEVRRRSGTWLDPTLADLFARLAENEDLWRGLESKFLDARLVALAPAEASEPVDDDYLDSIAAAFGQVVDAKSPFTAGHSTRVAEFAMGIGGKMGVPQARTRWLRRAALLHDIGKLGVSNKILDKPGKLDETEWEVMRTHASHTQEILGRVGVLADLAPVAAAHHERLDGSGYPLGLQKHQIGRETRIITICDFYDALTADRPYRSAMPSKEALSIIEGEVGRGVDGDCFEVLRTHVASSQ